MTGSILLIDKPYGLTSFDVIRKVKKATQLKVGHAGTLDPLATGLLLVCTGDYTKQIQFLQGMEKEYTGTFLLGKKSASYDLETAVEEGGSLETITEERINNVVQSLTGEIEQRPPAHSAIKVNGKRAYTLARQGIDAPLASRKVHVHSFRITRVALPELDFAVVCSKGTYIRSLAHDVGERLGCGALLSSLRRTRIGEYSVESALTLDKLTAR